MKTRVKNTIERFIEDYEARSEISTVWGPPQVGFADARHPYIRNLKKLIGQDHKMPEDVLEDASVVVAYFVPFTKELAESNAALGELASSQWARAYEETNAMLSDLNQHLTEKFREWGYQAGVSPEAATFDQKKLKSNWSHRHFAYAAGLGTFGLNNMLITRAGCCGRYSTVVTNLQTETDRPIEEELCLYKKNGNCGVCVRRCRAQALTLEGYDRNRCYEVCKENAQVHTGYGNSYQNKEGDGPNSEGSEVCGKCVVKLPCSFWEKRR